MIILIQLLRWFSMFFGTTAPPPQEERKWAIYLACLLGCMAMIAITAFFVLLKLSGL